jgi:hypothetical protein
MIPREIILARNAFASLMAVYNVITVTADLDPILN